jgi:hypothetical protein
MTSKLELIDFKFLMLLIISTYLSSLTVRARSVVVQCVLRTRSMSSTVVIWLAMAYCSLLIC